MRKTKRFDVGGLSDEEGKLRVFDPTTNMERELQIDYEQRRKANQEEKAIRDKGGRGLGIEDFTTGDKTPARTNTNPDRLTPGKLSSPVRQPLPPNKPKDTPKMRSMPQAETLKGLKEMMAPMGTGGTNVKPRSMNADRDKAYDTDVELKKGGKVSSASKRADGCAIRGKTRA